MSYEQDRAHDRMASDAGPYADPREPGRASHSQLLRKPATSVASGILARKPRDANGVAEGADHAVAAAASSSGSALPGALMRKFEASLGADLSGVRVHTGDASAAANDAVGAKAYTLGQDIHFGAGHYNPSSPAGEHLLAHEVAHTVQQAGGAQRMQYQLAVSSPGDHLEHEADRAADAMVAGLPAAVGSARGLARAPGNGLPSAYDKAHGADVEAAQEAGARPDPSDVYRQPPLNWDTLAVAAPGPRTPGIWTVPPLVFAQPAKSGVGVEAKAYLRPDGKPAAAATEYKKPWWHAQWLSDCAKANHATHEFRLSYQQAAACWNRAVPGITLFNTAAATAEAQELNGVGSVGFDAPKPGEKQANLDAYGDAQMLGNDDDKVSLSSLFTNGNDKPDVDSSIVKKGEAVDTAIDHTLLHAEHELKKKLAASAAWTLQGVTNGRMLEQAAMGVKVVENGRSLLEIEKDNTRLAFDKAQWAVMIDGTTKVLSALCDLAAAAEKADPLAMIKGDITILGTAARAFSDVKYDTAINDNNKAMLAIRTEVMSNQGYIASSAVENITDVIDSHTKAEAGLKGDLKIAYLARTEAYNALGTQLSSNALQHGASAEQARKLNAAIRAIPVTEVVLEHVEAVIADLSSPVYNAESGLGFRAAGQPTDFLLGVSHLKGYVLQFGGYKSKWSARLTALRATVVGLNSKTEAKP